MASPFSHEQLTRLRDSARLIESQARRQDSIMRQWLSSAESTHRDREAIALDVEMSPKETALRQELADRTRADIEIARDLCVGTREHHLATCRMVTDLGERQALPSGELSLSHAVLIADDHADSREWLSIVLRHAGFIVRTASDGLDALLAACQFQPAVIVMDLTMPVLDGVEATRLIKACDELKDVKVIAYSALSAGRSAHTELFNAFLPKPSPPDKIVASVQNFMVA
jgi:CheY-like chemotaxis protein